MKFGTVPLIDAAGAILAHSLRTPKGAVKKGTCLGSDELQRLADAGIADVMVARLEDGDVGENAVAARIGAVLAGAGVRAADAFTGRANLFAAGAGVLEFSAEAIGELAAIDEAITLATLAPFQRVAAGQMVATVKVIPFAVPKDVVERAERCAAQPDAGLRVHPFRPLRAHLILTRFAHDKPSLLEKRKAAVADRVRSLGGTMGEIDTCGHVTDELAARLKRLAPDAGDIVMIFGTSAILDRRDVVPAALEAAGGSVERLGMPVDPGNLLMLGRLGPALAIGVPSCASSPKINGFDWVLERAFAGLPLDAGAVSAMGVGGLLGEIASRPQPRRGKGK